MKRRALIVLLSLGIAGISPACGDYDSSTPRGGGGVSSRTTAATGGAGDVGAELACRDLAQHYDEILADPEAHPGELGAIVGYAQSADDAQLRDVANRVENGPDRVGAFEEMKARCDQLGLG